jgi:N4-gp56 family major capsid protein
MNLTTYGDISPRTAAKAARRLLERGQALMVTERFGYSDPQPMNASKTRKWRRYKSLAPAVSPLAEGITPAGQKLSYEDVTANLEQYGDFVRITDVIQDTHEDPVLSEATDVIGEQAAETAELLRIAVLCGGSNVFYANSESERAHVASPMVLGDQRKIVRAFRRNRARTISQIVSASAKISTEPVAPAYFCICHTDLEPNIRAITGFVPTEKYADSSKALDGEIGKIESVRYICTVLVEPWLAAGAAGTTYLSSGDHPGSSLAADVYPMLFIARNSYAIVPLQGADAVGIKVKNPGPATDSDPLGQRGFVSWKAWQAAAILQELWVARLEVACTSVLT